MTNTDKDVRTVMAGALSVADPDASSRQILWEVLRLSRDVVQWLQERTSGFPADDARLAGYADLVACLQGADPVLVPE